MVKFKFGIVTFDICFHLALLHGVKSHRHVISVSNFETQFHCQPPILHSPVVGHSGGPRVFATRPILFPAHHTPMLVKWLNSMRNLIWIIEMRHNCSATQLRCLAFCHRTWPTTAVLSPMLVSGNCVPQRAKRVVTRTHSKLWRQRVRSCGPGLWNSFPSHLKDADLS